MKNEFETSPPGEPVPPIPAAVERRLKWNELALRIEHYKYYLTRALHVTIFFYAITGGVLGFYLQGPAAFQVSQARANSPTPINSPTPTDSPTPASSPTPSNSSTKADTEANPKNQADLLIEAEEKMQTKREVKYREQLEYFLLLPILMGSVLGGVFIYGARLQEKAVDAMEHLRYELRERLQLDVGELYDAQLLNILLRIFGYMYFGVAILLWFLPELKETPMSCAFNRLAIGAFVMGVLLPYIAKFLNHRLKIRRANRMLAKLKRWCDDSPEFKGKRTDDYYALRYYLGPEVTETIWGGADGFFSPPKGPLLEVNAQDADAQAAKEAMTKFNCETGDFKSKWESRGPKLRLGLSRLGRLWAWLTSA